MIDHIISAGSASTRFAQRVDPRAKFILLFLYYFGLFMIPAGQLLKLAGCVAFLFALLMLAKIPLGGLIRFLLKIYPMILFISFMQILQLNNNETVSTVKIYSVVSQDVFTFQLKSLLIVSAGFIFIASTPFTQIVTSLKRMKLPGPVVAVIFFAYQFLFILARELDRIHTALRSRYIKLSLGQRLVLIKNLMVTYFLRLFDRSEVLNKLLLSRGFNGSFHFNVALTWRRTDSMVVAGGSVIIIFILFIV